ncbi:MAG: hypothetical protein IT450_11570 [Phycisphaerales bacterium]|nr:hypothetical protein [Phycisphaerales bacterium]
MDSWKRQFIDKLGKAQVACAKRFEDSIDDAVNPVFQDLQGFLRDNGFKVSQPLREQGRRSYKFELAENAYLLVIMRFNGVGELEIRYEIFVPGNDPQLSKSVGRLADVSAKWADEQFRSGLDRFINLLAGEESTESAFEELAVV